MAGDIKITAVALAIACMLSPVVTFAAGAPLQVITVSQTDIRDETPIAGTVAGTETVDARARIGGMVTKMLVERGAIVKKGQLLAVVVDTKLPRQVNAAAQQKAAAEAQVKLAETNVKRMQSLLPLDAASPLQVEQAEAQLKAAQAALAGIDMQAAGVDGASADGRIVAPQEGIVSVLRAVTGTIVMPGEPLATVDMHPLVVRLAMPQRHAGKLQAGDSLALELPTGTAEGKISRIYPNVENGGFRVDVVCEGLENLKVGERVNARISTGTHRGFLVPQKALFTRNGLSFVTLKSGAQVVVQPGTPRLDGTIEILSGLNEGDGVALP